VEHCGGDEHVSKYVHSTSFFCCPLLLSLEFCPLTPVAFFFTFARFLFLFGLGTPRHRHPPTAFSYAKAFNADISKWDTAAVTNMALSTSFCCPLLLSLEFCPLTPVAFYFTFSQFYLFSTAPTSSYSVLFCFCLQRGHFQVEHCGGDDHE
jgi:surface protein